MSEYKPAVPFSVAAFLLKPNTQTIKGVTTKSYITRETPFFCSFRTFGGTETTINDILVVENTAVVETWYDPEIKAGCNVKIDDTIYEILGTPENINMRYQYLKFKIRALKGGA